MVENQKITTKNKKIELDGLKPHRSSENKKYLINILIKFITNGCNKTFAIRLTNVI